MAKKRLRKKAEPKLFKNPQERLKAIKKRTVAELQMIVAKDLEAYGYDVKKTPKYVVATEAQMRKRGIIDLKYGFSKSKKRKTTKDKKGWYMVIPIKRKARSFKPSTVYKKATAEARELDPGFVLNTTIKGLAEGLNTHAPQTLSSLQNRAKSDNLTMAKSLTGKRTSYVTYRTVSNKSKPNSWIVGRENMTDKNTSKTLEANIKRTMEWKMRQIGGK